MYGQLISSVTVGAGGASSIDFTSIPQTFTDLVIVCCLRTNNGYYIEDAVLRFNSDTGNNYSARRLYGNGSSAASGSTGTTDSLSVGYTTANTATSNVFGNSIITIPNYAGSTQKSVSSDAVSENNATSANQTLVAGIWTGTAAITSIKLFGYGNNLLQYSTAYLYGLTKGSGGATVS